MELGGEMEGKELLLIEHPSHDHPLVLRESLQGSDGYGGGGIQVCCDGCGEPISSSSSSSSFYSSSSSGAGGGGGAFYACRNSDYWYLLHKHCAELPPKIEHPCHPEHAPTLRLHLLRDYYECYVCGSTIDELHYRCSDCSFCVDVRCALMAVHIHDRVDENNRIHQHLLISLEKEAEFLCDACGREHKGKSYLCPTCGFWANQICASGPTTVDIRSHPHPLALFRCLRDDVGYCEICCYRVERASWVYRCSEGCSYLVHVGCPLSEEAENSNNDIQTKLHSDSTSHKIEILTDPKEEIIPITWPVHQEPIEIITQLIKNLSLQGRHKRATKISCCSKDNHLIFVNKKIDKSKDDQLCGGCVRTISSQFYHCTQCNFSLHKWCAMLPSKLQHISHPEHPLYLMTEPWFDCCRNCRLPYIGFGFGCSTCEFYLDLKCASLPRLIKHEAHDHNLVQKRNKCKGSFSGCNACGGNRSIFSTYFQCEACYFRLCMICILLPFSARHRYDKHPFVLIYSPIKGQPDEYYCEICEADINSNYWFYHCIECDQSLHQECIYPIEQFYM